ncbi:MAG: FIST N-terminal domain-containing protein [Actinomycetota bacterium]
MTDTSTIVASAGLAAARRWSAVGASRDPDSRRAGHAAARSAAAEPDTKLFVVFAGHRHDHDALLAGIAEVAGSTPVIGCTTGGEIGVAGPTDDGVVVMAIGGAGVTVATRAARVRDGDLRQAGADAADAMLDVPDADNRVLLLLSDGLGGDQQEVVRGAYSRAGATVPLVGGCAGDGMEMRSTTLFHGRHAGSDLVIGCALTSAGPIGIGVHHGWTPVGEPVLITRSDGNVVHTIDEQPALDRYLRLHGAPAELAEDPEAFTLWAATHPIGVHRRSREEVRFINGADPTTRSITSIAGIPEGGLAWAMTGSAESVLDATDIACAAAVDGFDGPAVGVLAFDCVARRGVMGEDGIITEVERIADRVGAPIAGFYTYGEFARTQGASGFHNQTLVTLAIG